jgi:hypothetical protein
LYKVLKYFRDLQDDNFAYDVGDEYPRKGLSVLPSRINELASKNNRQGVPLIEEITEIKEEPKKKKSVKKADEE